MNTPVSSPSVHSLRPPFLVSPGSAFVSYPVDEAHLRDGVISRDRSFFMLTTRYC